MRKTVRGALAATTAMAAGVAGAVVLTAAPAQAADAEARQRVDLGMNARSLGAYVRTQNVDLRPVRLGFANTSCTRTLGRQTTSEALTVPVGDFIDLQGVRSRNRTYKSGTKVGVRATTTIAKVTVGAGTGPGLAITGLKAEANAFNNGRTLGAQQSFTFEGLDITGVSGGTGPLGDLLDAIGGGVNQVIRVLEEQDQPIEIPGLARISLGDEQPQITRGRSAVSQVSGLRIQLLVGNLADVTVGDAYARIGKGATAGVLGISSQALEGSLVNDLIGVGATNRRTIPCEGTQNTVQTFRRETSGIVAPVVVDISDAVARQRGVQRGSNGSGFGRHSVGNVQIVPDELSPLLPTVTIRDIDAKVTVDGNFAKKGSKRVKRTVTSSVGALLISGREVTLPRPGRTRNYDEGRVQVTRAIVEQGFYGAEVTAIRVKYLPNLISPGLEPVTLNFGVVDADFIRG
ncbi:hypothetical protein GCM10009737_36070 [Nocardioides lentus]|uniref:Uncharacterized protein n=1 Tax=Nocardioides lentus TaxID=338077 RepID=A0ABP5B4R1_9ACTN